MERPERSSRTPARETSTWFEAHAYLVGPGVRVLDLACGTGRHAIAAGLRGAEVVAIDWSSERLAIARERAQRAGVRIDFRRENLEIFSIPVADFDVVMAFNYLDRRRFADIVRAVRPGGYLLYETFHVGQASFGWGPTSPDYLLEPRELLQLVQPLIVEFSREVVETIDTRSAAKASVVARCPQQ